MNTRSLTMMMCGAALLAACDSDDSADPVPHLALTDEATLVTGATRGASSDSRNPAVPAERSEMLAAGFGDTVAGPGEPHVTRVLGGATAPSPATDAALVARIVHFADAQLADDESPLRVASLDRPGATSGAHRPQDAYGCHMIDAMVRAFTTLDLERPLDLVLLGGDNIDNAQQNELRWWLTLMSQDGGELECDSGADDDPVPGPGNDPKDPIVAGGMGPIPWLWVTGNHDILVQGNFVVDDGRRAAAIEGEALTGTRDWSQAGGPVVSGTVPADAERALVDGVQLLTRVAAHGDGHGIGASQAASGKAFYASDIAGTDLRVVVMDTTAPTGGAGGVLRKPDVDALLVPLLDQALSDGRRVIVAAHHAAGSLGNGGGLGGTAQADALTSSEYIDLVTGYPNVVLSLVGHSHQHRILELVGPGRSVFEVTTAALADYPHQARLVELWDEGDSWLRVRTTAIDVPVGDDGLIEEGRRLGVMDWVAGWADENGSDADDRNVDLWVAQPL